MTGRLARENAMRKPGRTAVTAAALMIGLAMVVFVTVFAAGISSSMAERPQTSRATSSSRTPTASRRSRPRSPPRSAACAGSRASALPPDQAKVQGRERQAEMAGVDPRNIAEVFALEWKDGSNDTIESLAEARPWWTTRRRSPTTSRSATRCALLGPTGRRAAFQVVGRIKDNADFFWATSDHASRRWRATSTCDATPTCSPTRRATDAGAVEQPDRALLKTRYPSAEALNQQQLKEDQEEQLKPLLALIYGLLFLAVVVSIFGIVNTLALSIHERRASWACCARSA